MSQQQQMQQFQSMQKLQMEQSRQTITSNGINGAAYKEDRKNSQEGIEDKIHKKQQKGGYER